MSERLSKSKFASGKQEEKSLGRINAVDLEHVLGDIQTECACGRLLM
jgi:hypothetical protein